MEQSAYLPFDAKTRAFWAGFAALLLVAGVYTALVIGSWARTPLGRCPQGEAAAWLSGAESLYKGTTVREPFFRAPAYLTVLAGLRAMGVSALGLAKAARILNGCAHVLSTALLMGIGWQFWRRRGSLLAGALWGFYPPAVFMAAQVSPETLALFAWLIGVAAGLGAVWQSPIWVGGHLSHRHVWVYPALAGVAFALAAALSSVYWPVALIWPVVAVFLGRDARGSRVVAAILGVGVVALGIIILQDIWGGSPQPLAGADLYRLARALDITQPLAAPQPAVELASDQAIPDRLVQEALLTYEIQMQRVPAGLAVLDGYWWRAAVRSVTDAPAHAAWRALRKTFQLLGPAEYSAGPDYARARAEIEWLRYNPLRWGWLLALGLSGVVIGRRSPTAGLALALSALAGVGGLVWYPTAEARLPVAVMLALLTGGLVAWPWPRELGKKTVILGLMLGALALAWWPQPNAPDELIARYDRRERAQAWAALGQYEDAIRELTSTENKTLPTFLDRDLAANWRFSLLLKNLPTLPPPAELERQLLDNADLAAESSAAQFRCGASLWLLGRSDGALYFWENLANGNNVWGAAARTALALSGRESAAQAQRRAAWEIGGGPRPDPALMPFFAKLSADQTGGALVNH